MTDPGLQLERTTIAWTRTALSALGVGVLLAKLSVQHHDALQLFGAVCAVGVAASCAIAARRRPGRGHTIATSSVRITAATLGALVTTNLLNTIASR